MNNTTLESYLAVLYTDAAARDSFLGGPAIVARNAGLSDADVEALVNIDRVGLQMAADSYAHKRANHRLPKKSLRESIEAWWARWQTSR